MVSTSKDFDSGGGCSLTVDDANNHVDITVEEDAAGGWEGYFHFRLTDVAGEDVSFEITNQADITMYDHTRVKYTSDLGNLDWELMDESIGGGWTQTFDSNEVHVSNVCAYPYSHIVDRVNELDSHRLIETEVIGQSEQGRDMHAVRITDPDVPDYKKWDVVCMTRQHPGETQGSYHMDGAIDAVLGVLDDDVMRFGRDYVFHFIPCSNPDGVYNGYHRHDSLGNDLNRVWQDSTPPVEVQNIQDYMRNNLENIYWGFDFHSGNGESYHAGATYHPPAPSEDDLEVIEEIATHSKSASGIADELQEEYGMGWFYTEFERVGIVTEVGMYHPYTPDMLYEEGEGFMMTILEDKFSIRGTKYIRENGSWVQPGQS